VDHRIFGLTYKKNPMVYGPASETVEDSQKIRIHKKTFGKN
jgi:hypothetical protein